MRTDHTVLETTNTEGTTDAQFFYGEIMKLQKKCYQLEEELKVEKEQLEAENETLKSVNNELVRTLTKVASQAKPIIFAAEDKDDAAKIKEFLNKYAVSFK